MQSLPSEYTGAIGEYTLMWLRRCSPCPVCGMPPHYEPLRSSDSRLYCTHRESTVMGAEPIIIDRASIQQAVSDWNTNAGHGWTQNGIIPLITERESV